MTTPFDDVIINISAKRYHNHRREEHSNIVSEGILRDLLLRCAPIRSDFEAGRIQSWFNIRTPGARERKVDLLIGESLDGYLPDLSKIRICVENKSVITAHRNKDARYDDLNEMLQVIHSESPVAIIVATVLIGTSDRYLNVPDRISPFHEDFEEVILPRLSRGDQLLWEEFRPAVSKNRRDDAFKTMQKFRSLPTRQPGHTHVEGYDYLMLVPVAIDNVNPPALARANSLGINIDEEYSRMLFQMCKAYSSRFP